MPQTDTRKKVEAAIIQCIADAEAQGVDGALAAHRTFPGTPDTVLWGCWSEWESQHTEAWWQSVESKIGGDVIRNAIAATGPRQSAKPWRRGYRDLRLSGPRSDPLGEIDCFPGNPDKSPGGRRYVSHNRLKFESRELINEA